MERARPTGPRAGWIQCVVMARDSTASRWSPRRPRRIRCTNAQLRLIGGVSFNKGLLPGTGNRGAHVCLGKLKKRMYRLHFAEDASSGRGQDIFRAGFGDQSIGKVFLSSRRPRAEARRWRYFRGSAGAGDFISAAPGGASAAVLLPPYSLTGAACSAVNIYICTYPRTSAEPRRTRPGAASRADPFDRGVGCEDSALFRRSGDPSGHGWKPRRSKIHGVFSRRLGARAGQTGLRRLSPGHLPACRGVLKHVSDPRRLQSIPATVLVIAANRDSSSGARRGDLVEITGRAARRSRSESRRNLARREPWRTICRIDQFSRPLEPSRRYPSRGQLVASFPWHLDSLTNALTGLEDCSGRLQRLQPDALRRHPFGV